MGIADPAAADSGRENRTGTRPASGAASPARTPRWRPSTATVLRAVPGTEEEWVSAADRISFLLTALAAAEANGRVHLEPLHAVRALKAWARVEGPVLAAVRAAPAATPGAVLVSAADVDTLGAAARLLGRVLCEDRVHGTGGEVAGTLIREARTQATAPERLVAQLARVHGVLDVAPLPADRHLDIARVIWRAGA